MTEPTLDEATPILKVTDSCRVDHRHTVGVEFDRANAPRFHESGYRSRDVAILRISVDVDANTGRVDAGNMFAVSVHTAVEVKKDGTPGLRNASLWRVPYADLPEEVREAVEARGREIAHEVTL